MSSGDADGLGVTRSLAHSSVSFKITQYKSGKMGIGMSALQNILDLCSCSLYISYSLMTADVKVIRGA